MKKTLIFLTTICYLLSSTASVFALTIPSFPSCANPQGQIKVTYSDGTHGIVGSGATYTGKDTVYTLSDDTVTQCFCAADGQGIQTNWWKASSLSESDINILKSQGWHYVPTGSLWGLAADPYVAQNLSYRCLGGGSSTSQDNGVGGGDVLGDSTGEVLGLAATGDSILVYASMILGLGLTIIGIKRFKQTH